MKIFLPFPKDANNYFDEIIKYSASEFVFDHYLNYDSSFEIVNIHWPESIFNWKSFSLEELNNFERAFLYWKKHSKIIYTVHNLKPHSEYNINHKRLYKLVTENADVFIHLGEYSKEMFEKQYTNAVHYLVRHPLYINSFSVFNEYEARNLLKIQSDALVIIAPGRIRNKAEKKMIMTAFGAIRNKKKILIVPNMYKKNIWNKLPGYYKFKKIFSRPILKKSIDPKFFFRNEYQSHLELALMMSAADLVFVPRIEILNSGNVFLGLTYGKMIVGPDQGNIKEHLEMFDFPIFNPHSPKSVKKAIIEGVKMLEKKNHKINSIALEAFYPNNVAAQFDNLIKKIASGI
ncbi:hypothetical protein [Flavobacterium sp. SORGH_AS_0622]|uniref:hypothetical protein n=1 Tax=Flavobacterium sp. SORGH_AS_0622 TaxID=3041772 RepID=UPI002784052C|nr:hypothetical protein [Flavobacterium sp. SORGH_AS_0622]MDQ1167493.1 hypothetical protein [Flavobacterium sp. SORGH_AS_0622]